MKKLLNDSAEVVAEMMAGLVATQPGLTRVAGRNIILRSDLPVFAERAVAVISGGGSGHEPAHAGYVGRGMLTAAVLGDVFTSPSGDNVLEAIEVASGPAGALLIIKNYTGDRLNFVLAAEIARARGVPVDIVVVADDVALDGIVDRERRRGIAGTVLVHKVAGAAAQQGLALETVRDLAQRAANSVRSMGVALGSCTLPAAKSASFTLGDEEIEFGLGIHGEMGARRSILLPADAIVVDTLEQLLANIAEHKKAPQALLVNGLGATAQMELMIVARGALALLQESGVTVERVWVGNFMTALEMPGFSLSLMTLDPKMSALFDLEASAPAWPGDGRLIPKTPVILPDNALAATPTKDGPLGDTIRTVMLDVALALEQAEPLLTELDSVAGDGDLGASMVRGASALRDLAKQRHATPAAGLEALSYAVRREIAGSSGPFHAIALMRAARSLGDSSSPGPADWANALGEAISAIATAGGAKPGDRTKLDALSSAHASWQHALDNASSTVEMLNAAAAGAHNGAQATSTMMPRVGRASYIGARAIGNADAGATAVAIWMTAIAASLRI